MRLVVAAGTLALATLASAPALADCVPGSGLCAGVGATVGIPVPGVPGVTAGGQVTVGIPPFFGPPAPPPPAPPPQTVIVQPYPSAPPPQVYVVPGSYYAAPPPPRYVARPDWGAPKFGLDLRIDGAAGLASHLHPSYGLGGAGLDLKWRLARHFALELGLDVLGGRDYNEDKRVEVSGNLGGLIYFNPRSRVQVYMSGGLLADHAKATPTVSQLELWGPPNGDLIYNHVGGYGGLGLEFFATQHLSFHLDARGLVRQKVSGTPGPEFTDPATGRTTNTSGGIVGQGGMTVYF
jgi:hypothetical protein